MPDVYDEHLVAQYDQHSFIWRLYVPTVRALLERTPDAALLDLGCGTGSLIMELQQFYSTALGVDISTAMIDRAQRKAAQQPESPVSFQVADIRSFHPVDRYNVVTCTDGVLPYLHDDHELSLFLKMVSAALAPNGRALIETWTPAANPEPVDGARTFPPNSRLIPDELRDVEFIRESNTIPEADFARHRYYLSGRPYAYTVMKHGDQEVLHRHRYFDVSTELLPLLHEHELTVEAEFGVGARDAVPELQPYFPQSAIWAGVVHK